MGSCVESVESRHEQERAPQAGTKTKECEGEVMAL